MKKDMDDAVDLLGSILKVLQCFHEWSKSGIIITMTQEEVSG